MDDERDWYKDERDWYKIVAEEACDECGLVAATVARHALGADLVGEAERWGVLLTGPGDSALLRRRPESGVWSPLEYGAHVRDVMAVFADRVARALAEDEPEFGWWDHEAAAVDEHYNEQRPAAVASELSAAAQRLAAALAPLDDDAWRRAGTRRSRERFTIEGLARFALHEARHHRVDAERTLTDLGTDVGRCDECGFSYDLSRAGEAGQSIVDGVTDVAALLCETGTDVITRRRPETWSPLEYGCHLRDVLLVQRERVLAARRRDRPSFDPMGRDERVEHDGYAEQDPTDVARQLTDAAQLLADVLARLGPADWDRTLMYNYPKPFERSLRWVAVHAVHEVRHHLFDVQRQLL